MKLSLPLILPEILTLVAGCGGDSDSDTLDLLVVSNCVRAYSDCEARSYHEVNGSRTSFAGGGCGTRGINIQVLEGSGARVATRSFGT